MSKKDRKYNLKARHEKNEERRDLQVRISSDRIVTPPATDCYRRNYERIFNDARPLSKTEIKRFKTELKEASGL